MTETLPASISEGLTGLGIEELRQLYAEKQIAFGKATLELERRRRQKRIHVLAKDAPVGPEAGPDQRMIIGPELGFDVYNFHIFTSGRAAGSDRYHSHGDAIKFYVAGGGYEVVGDERYEVKVGDFMHVPGNIWHGTENPADEPLVFLAVQQFVGTLRQVPTPFVHEHPPYELPDEELTEEVMGGLDPWSMYRLYLRQQVEFGRVALEVHRRREQKKLYVAAGDAPLMEWGPGRHIVMAPEQGFDLYSFQIFLDCLTPGEEQGLALSGGDLVKLCLAGQADELVGDRRVEVNRGDFLHVPANSRHETKSAGGENLRYLCWQQLPGTFLQTPSPLLP